MTVLYPHPFWREALGEVLFNLATVAGWPLYPRHVADKPVHPVADYLAWLLKLARNSGPRRRAAAVEARWTAEGAPPFFLVGLQLATDYQIRHSAWFADQRAMVRAVVRSFAAHAPPGTRLLFKAHPLDNGWTDWRAIAAAEAAARGIADRVETIGTGDLGLLMRRSRGVVIANSTAGLLGLREGVPVKALGAAVYAMPGLTDPAPLRAFWQAPQAPDRALVAAFVATLAAETQVKGSIYNPSGRLLAARTIAERLVEGRVGPTGAPSRPPRLAALRAMRRALADGRAEP
jgi:capsular polysaccharide export protein